MRNTNRQVEVTEDEITYKKETRQRRPHRNLVRFWQEHASDYDEIDEFYAK